MKYKEVDPMRKVELQNAGHQAQRGGEPSEANPYSDVHSPEWQHWYTGWFVAQAESTYDIGQELWAIAPGYLSRPVMFKILAVTALTPTPEYLGVYYDPYYERWMENIKSVLPHSQLSVDGWRTVLANGRVEFIRIMEENRD